MFFPINPDTGEQGSALVAAVIVLALLTALGFAALNVADLNISIAANDRDAKEAFFHADAGANVGHVLLEDSIKEGDSKYYENYASTWESLAIDEDTLNASTIKYGTFYEYEEQRTLVWFGKINTESIKFEELGRTKTNYRIRSDRLGVRHSSAIVDLGWRHINTDFR
jgi:Tfp pilus assembly protein PilX